MAAFVLDSYDAQHVAWAVDSYQLSLIGAPMPGFNAQDNATRLWAAGLVGRALANVTNVKLPATFAPDLNNPAHSIWTLTTYTLGVFAPPMPNFDANNQAQCDAALQGVLSDLARAQSNPPPAAAQPGPVPGGPRRPPPNDPAITARATAAPNQAPLDIVIGRYVVRHSDQLFQSDIQALADILQNVQAHTSLTVARFLSHVLEGANWNTALRVTGEVVMDVRVAADTNTLIGTWTTDCRPAKERKRRLDFPDEEQREIKKVRQAGASAYLKLSTSSIAPSWEVVDSKCQYGNLDNVTLLPGIDFHDIMAEGLQKFDEADEKTSEKYNRHFLTLTARNRLYHWYSQPLDQFSPPVYLNVAGEAVFAPKKTEAGCARSAGRTSKMGKFDWCFFGRR